MENDRFGELASYGAGIHKNSVYNFDVVVWYDSNLNDL